MSSFVMSLALSEQFAATPARAGGVLLAKHVSLAAKNTRSREPGVEERAAIAT